MLKMTKTKKILLTIGAVVLAAGAFVGYKGWKHYQETKPENYTVTGNSMEPTFKDGDVCVVNKQYTLDRSDIVVFKFNDKEYIKRVIGLPNDTIYCWGNTIYVNGEPIEESYVQGETTDFNEITLEDDEFFCLGDNREYSKDSRYFGRFKTSYIIGEVNQ